VRHSLVQQTPVVVAHRAAPARVMSWSECDVMISNDGIPFVHHDYIVPGLGFGFEHSWTELQSVEPALLPLEEYLAVACATGVRGVLVDVKTGFQVQSRVYESVTALLARMDLLDRVLIVDWDWAAIAAFRMKQEEAMLGAALRGRVPNLRATLRETDVDYLYMDWDIVRASDVNDCHELDVAVAVLEGWEKRFYDLVVALGIDFVLSDHPKECSEALASAARRV
jgi:glycerophosphoryl diester phosphodiesterase